ncbi:MAG: Asp-tRNA(Asn)/Glu-tRNA(Gln) amidotransferase subunit GatA [Patescibacteria group bacterium]
MDSLFGVSIKQIHEKLEQREISALELAQLFLSHIQEREKDLHAFITIMPELAFQQAKEIDKKVKEGQSLPLLAGIPCAIKDSILVKGARCTAGSHMLEDYVAPYNATVVQRLREQGVLLMGKTNTDEFSMGSSTENSAFGPTRNPHDLSRVAGGSSGGSAASVAADEVVVALGGDTGGSIRLPASFCGIVGLKPTYGAVSRYGLIALASSLDQIGPLAKTVEDCEILFNALKGRDPFDSTSVDFPSNLQSRNCDPQDLRIGVPREYFKEGLMPQVEQVIKNAIAKFEAAGAKVEEITLPHAPYALAVYYIINSSEASANLARYDGMRYGTAGTKHQMPNVSLLDIYLERRGEGFGPEVKRRIVFGAYALSAGYYDAYYTKAQKIRTLLKQDFEQAFQKVDVIVGPVSPVLPFKIGEKIENPLSMYLVDMYTVPVNLAGIPGLSIPAGNVQNLPVGLQLIAPAFSEHLLFQVGKMFEKIS